MSTAAYYDTWRERQLEDYRVRNPRVVAALSFALPALRDAHTVLDVGCGIGWTTAEIADLGKKTTGVDISPILIDTARRMFGDTSDFIVGDFMRLHLGRFDAVVMIDVYEHFPRDCWPLVHQRLRRSVGSKLILSVPTPQTQQYARDNGIPLQPVDEDVTDEDIEQLAESIDGAVVRDRHVSIWRANDYRHVHIHRERRSSRNKVGGKRLGAPGL